MSTFLQTHLFIIWDAIAAVFVIIELFKRRQISLWIAVSALITGCISFLSVAFGWQIVIFIVLSICALLFVRLAIQKKMKDLRVNSEENNPAIGKELELIKAITAAEQGEVKDDNGKTWPAISDDGTDIPAGTICLVTTEDAGVLHVIAIRNKAD